ncbi:MAG: two-component regulator propeller domain-containing protein, partial [Bacteroidota bacterium]
MDLQEWNSASILAMAEHNGYLYLGTSEDGLLKYDATDQTVTIATTVGDEAILPEANIKTIYELKEGLLLGGENVGLHFTDFHISNPISLKREDFSPRVVSTIHKKENQFWIGTERGIVVLDSLFDIQETIFKESKSLNSIVGNSITVLNKDYRGNIWIGTEYNGISILNNVTDPLSYYYGDITGDNMYSVLSIFPDEDRLLIGTDGQGLLSLSSTTSAKRSNWISHSKGFSADFVKPILKDKAGTYYFGSYLNGVTIVSADSTIKKFSDHLGDTRISSNNISDLVLVEDKLFVGTWDGGLNILDLASNPVRNKILNTGNSNISHNDISDLEYDNNNTIWVATYGGGLNRLDITSDKIEVQN